MESESSANSSWRVILLGIVFCGTLAASCILGSIYGRDVLDWPFTREADATILEMTSEHVERRFIWEVATVWRVQYLFRDEAGHERTGIDRVAAPSELRRKDTVRVWYSDNRSGMVNGFFRPAPWGKWVFVGAVVVCVGSAMALARIAVRRVRTGMTVAGPVSPAASETNPGGAGAASTGDWVRKD